MRIGDAREDHGRASIAPTLAPNYDLDLLLEEMTQDSFPEPLDFGTPIGSEVW